MPANEEPHSVRVEREVKRCPTVVTYLPDRSNRQCELWTHTCGVAANWRRDSPSTLRTTRKVKGLGVGVRIDGDSGCTTVSSDRNGMREQGATDAPTHGLWRDPQMLELPGWRPLHETVEPNNPLVDFGDECWVPFDIRGRDADLRSPIFEVLGRIGPMAFRVKCERREDWRFASTCATDLHVQLNV